MRWFLLFTVVPLAELWLLLRVGARIGAGATLLWVLCTALVGAAMVRSQGLDVLRRLVETVRAGGSPALPLAEGVLVVLGGALLITPGLLTDLVGLLLLVPAVRARLAPRVLAWAARRVTVAGTAPPPRDPFASPFDDPR
jgi:UPF0716 protein FxsA